MNPFNENTMASRPGGVSLKFLPHQLPQQPHFAPMPMRVSGARVQPLYPSSVHSSGQPAQYSAKTTAVISAPPVPAANVKPKPTTQVLAQDVNLVKPKRPEPKASSSSSSSKTKKQNRFLRTAGGTSWEDPSLGDWEQNDFRLFCGDLGNEVSDELLEKAFRKYPSFLRAKVVRDRRSNKTKGYGFISFKDPQDFIRAMREMDGKYVGNRPIKLRKSTWKERASDMVRKKAKERQKLGLML